MTFNIGNQQGGIINNINGDHAILGGQNSNQTFAQVPLLALDDLRDALSTQAPIGKEVGGALRDIECALGVYPPDASRVAESVEKLTLLLRRTGRLAAAGADLIGPLRTLAEWLGRWGAPILTLLR